MSTNPLLIRYSICSWLWNLCCSRLFYFRLSSNNCTILGALYLSNCTVPGILYLSNCRVPGVLYLSDCMVPGVLCLSDCMVLDVLISATVCTRCPVPLRLYATWCPVSHLSYDTRCPVSLRLYGTRCSVCEVVAGVPCCSVLYLFKQLGVFLLVTVPDRWCVLQCRAYHSDVGGGPDRGGAVSEATTRSCHRFVCDAEAGTVSSSMEHITQVSLIQVALVPCFVCRLSWDGLTWIWDSLSWGDQPVHSSSTSSQLWRFNGLRYSGP